jgi:hypothetical protein
MQLFSNAGLGKKGIQFHPFPAEGKKVETIYHFFPKIVSFSSDFFGKKDRAQGNGWMNCFDFSELARW